MARRSLKSQTGFAASATLDSRLPEIVAALQRKVGSAVKDGAELVAECAAEKVPLGPPPHHLKDDIHVERVGAAEYSVVAGREDTYYGHILEHGSVKMAARPFLIPALEESAPEIVAIVEAALQ